MKRNLFDLDIKYHVNTDQKVVIAYLSDLPSVVGRGTAPVIDNLYNNLVEEFICVADDFDTEFNNVTVKGVARCAEGDQFDVNYGKKLAKARLLAKLYVIFERSIEKRIKQHEDNIRQLNQLQDFTHARKRDLRCVIKKLYDRI